MKNSRLFGFTLVELVIVIMILGVLAAVALPKFVNLGTEARKASLEGLKSALNSAANLANVKCQLDSSCDINANGGAIPQTTINGQVIYFHYGYPTGWGRFGVDDGVGGIRDLVDYSGFTYQPHIGGTFLTVFTLNGAPNPSNCKVNYQMTHNSSKITVSVTSSGC